MVNVSFFYFLLLILNHTINVGNDGNNDGNTDGNNDGNMLVIMMINLTFVQVCLNIW